MAKRNWTRFEVLRKDKKRNHLFEIRQLSFSKNFEFNEKLDEEIRDTWQKMLRDNTGTLKKELRYHNLI
jgi:hypothetical protein